MPPNPLLALPFEPQLEGLGADYWDVVEAAQFPRTQLRFRNDSLLHQIGLNPASVSDADIEAAYGRFEARTPLLALRYHGHQFGTYNPFLGDGRGFLYGQLRDRHGQLQDLGTKGSGTTPWSRGGDGRLTLKGGVREVIAGEALQRLGVTTSRSLSLVETGEDLYRGDEPSPTRSAVMVRLARTHLRFGSCERMLHQRQPRQLERLLQHVVITYYPEVAATEATGEARLLAFYGELVERVARLSAEWMAAGFTHGVLNTDNMSLAGESFDYGPFAFLDQLDPRFTAAYFDHAGLYAYGQQPAVAHQNLRLLQEPLVMLLPRAELEARLERFAPAFDHHYRQLMARRLGLPPAWPGEGDGLGEAPDPLPATLQLLAAWPVGYGSFFAGLAARVAEAGLPSTPDELGPFLAGAPQPPRQPWLAWRDAWWACSHQAANTEANSPDAASAASSIADRLQRWNLPETPVRRVIERLWEAIDQADDWQPFHDWLARTVVKDD
ncbi:YdiU family protein [Cyanobium sp. LEGE 06113]|uniref:protein adenylyltransferase SelO n=1 Tax=Cyanobium sp. LEGE 06113 TaxID=1297573 RepID=UPI00187DF972|nr:YdiU family protein [Cyanobium sp. LEGE 06113]MBE9152833.1 YdiU family protein [Cyanobium sp. LEGE 06113]MBE9152962.1 YdiU family protein [Cyanobium sp. LEGE 06113]